jgi:hypothetical protein
MVVKQFKKKEKNIKMKEKKTKKIVKKKKKKSSEIWQVTIFCLCKT